MCGKYKEPVPFFNKKTFYVYRKKKITAEHCSQNWRISHVKSKGIQCLKNLDMTADFSVLVAFIRLTSELIRAYFCFSVTYFNVTASFVSDGTRKVVVLYANADQTYTLMKIEI